MATSLPLGSLGLMTFAEFERMPDNGDRYELRNGEPVKVPPPVNRHFLLQRRLRRLLEPFAETAGIVDTEWGFLADTLNYRRADVAFVSHRRTESTPPHGYLDGAPELVIEVLSPSNRRGEIRETKRLCFENGCQEFWLVDPNRQTVAVDTPGGSVRIYREGEQIPLLFGGTVEVNAIFA